MATQEFVRKTLLAFMYLSFPNNELKKHPQELFMPRKAKHLYSQVEFL